MKPPDAKVIVVGGGLARASAAYAMGARGLDVILVDRRSEYPVMFRAEKIEADQAEIMRRLGVLGHRRPLCDPVREVLSFEGGRVEVVDTVEQYGIDYTETVNCIREALLGVGVELINGAVSSIEADAFRPAVTIRDGRTLTATLVVLATGGSDKLIESLGMRRAMVPRLKSLSYGFDCVRSDGRPFDFVGFNHHLPPNARRIEYVTLFRIGGRMRANVFTRLTPRCDTAIALRKELERPGTVFPAPKRLRPYLHHDVRVAGAVLQIFLRAIRATLRRSSPAASSRAQLGAVSFFHRFGSSLNVHPHYHLVVLDGVFSKADDSEIAFHEAHGLTPDRIAQVESVVQKRVLRYFRRQGLLDEVDAAGMLTWQGSGGFSVDASVRIEAEDRAGIERLVR